MSVKFCIAIGKWNEIPQALRCSMDSGVSPQIATSFRLGSRVKLYYKSHTKEQLIKRFEKAQSLSDDTYDIWRFRMIYLLAAHERIFCINFIPANPAKGQIIQVMRLKDGKDVEQYEAYNFDYAPYKFILPVEHPDQVFVLSTYKISQAVAHLDSRRLIRVVKEALRCLSKASYLKGLALTLDGKDGKRKTCIWLK